MQPEAILPGGSRHSQGLKGESLSCHHGSDLCYGRSSKRKRVQTGPGPTPFLNTHDTLRSPQNRCKSCFVHAHLSVVHDRCAQYVLGPPAMAGQPHEHIDAALSERSHGDGSLQELASLEEQYVSYRRQRELGALAETPFTKPLQTKSDLRALRKLGVHLSTRYQALGFAVLAKQPELGVELFYRAMHCTAKSDEAASLRCLNSLAMGLSHRMPKVAARFLTQAVAVDASLAASARPAALHSRR